MKYLLTLVFSFCSFYAVSQKNSYTQIAATAGKINGKESRLVAMATHSYSPNLLSDSSSFRYAPGMDGYDTNLQSWNFDTCRRFDYWYSAVIPGIITKTYNADGRCTHELWIDSISTNPTTRFDCSRLYDANGNIIRMQIDELISVQNKIRYSYTYTPAGKIELELVEVSADGVTWAPSEQQRYIYNVNGSLANSYRDLVDASGGWFTHDRQTSIYTGSLLTTTIWEKNIGNWDTSVKFIYSYDAAGRKVSQELHGYDWNTNTWDTTDRQRYVYDAAGNVITEYYDSWVNSAYINRARVANNYNSYGQISSKTEGVYASTGTYDTAYLQTYCYEEYNTGVKTDNLDASCLTIYPSPAGCDINVSLLLDKPQVISCSILDLSGKRVLSWNDNGVQSYIKHINTSALVAGDYVLIVNMAGKVQLRKFAIVH